MKVHVMDDVVTKKRLSKGKIVGFVVISLIAAVVVGGFVWIHENLPVDHDPKELERHIALLESEELLGKTKQEVKELIGIPDSWRKTRLGIRHPKEGVWDDSVHVWSYGADNDEVYLITTIYYSHEGSVGYIHALYKNIETGELWSENQGDEKYLYR